MTTAVPVSPVAEEPGLLAWFREFLKGELSPSPGRLAEVVRMVLAATIVMLFVMTFRIPHGAYGAFHAMIISREDPSATLKAAKTNIAAFAFSILFVLVGAMLFAGDPMLRLLWVIAALFTVFFMLSAMTNYLAASRFGWLLVITIPIWDEHTTAEVKVEQTLWLAGTLLLANIVTVAIEWAFSSLYPGRNLIVSIGRRLTAVEQLLSACADGRAPDENTSSELGLCAMLGTSRLRRVLQRTASSLSYAEQIGAVLALVGRMVDVAVSLMDLNPHYAPGDRERCRSLASAIASIRSNLFEGKIPAITPIRGENHGTPILNELEITVSRIPQVFAGAESLNLYAPLLEGHAPPPRLLKSDAFTNPDHLKFAIGGSLAASLCYILYSGLAWPGISTAVTTCFLTALSTVGSSRQKQLLRITGALVGGAIGMLAQIFILPGIDSITGFTLLFLPVTFLGAWIMSSGPRLSYFGLQLVYAFYLIHLSGFTLQSSLSLARDRVVGILVGLIMMRLIFDPLWGARAIDEMKRTLVSLLRTLAKLAREPAASSLQAAIERSYALRETINHAFDNLRSLGDGVLFEIAPTRTQDLTERGRILEWQPQLRLLFLTRVTLFKYRLQLPGFELPAALQDAQQDYDACLARMLEGMADHLEGKTTGPGEELQKAYARLQNAIGNCAAAAGPEPTLNQRLTTFAALSERITGLALSLTRINQTTRVFQPLNFNEPHSSKK